MIIRLYLWALIFSVNKYFLSFYMKFRICKTNTLQFEIIFENSMRSLVVIFNERTKCTSNNQFRR